MKKPPTGMEGLFKVVFCLSVIELYSILTYCSSVSFPEQTNNNKMLQWLKPKQNLLYNKRVLLQSLQQERHYDTGHCKTSLERL